MGLAASVRNAFSRNTLAAATFAAAAAALPFSNAAAQTRAVPANSRPAASAPLARTASDRAARTPDLQAQLHSAGNAAVGVFINVREDARQRGISGDDIGKEIVDSLKARGVPAKYFFQNSTDGRFTLVSVYINAASYKNAAGDFVFRPRDISREFDGIKTKYMRTPMTAVVSGENGPSHE